MAPTHLRGAAHSISIERQRTSKNEAAPVHRMGLLGCSFLALLLAAGCSRAPEPAPDEVEPDEVGQYEVKGQIVGINPERQEVLLKHEDIPGFMRAMTMPFPVKDAALLEGMQPGDLVTATLVVGDGGAYVSALTRTGHAPVEAAPPGP